jgi:NAD(P)-dependent dehydrogenase (short-subunit alcohol dehydrogenase family)
VAPTSPSPTSASLSGRVALVTGAARGIGRAIAVALHAAGARVAVLDRDEPSHPAPDGANDETWFTVQADVSDEASVDAAFTRVERAFGAVSVLVNNAGILYSLPIAETTLEVWQRTLLINATGPFIVARRALPAMVEARYGRVLTIGSSAGKTGGAHHLAAYAASKAAVMSLAKSIGTEYAGHGITSNAIAPAAIDTDMIANLASVVDRIPVGRLGRPEDVAAAAVFLCSEAASFVTAEVMDVNGGFLVD